MSHVSDLNIDELQEIAIHLTPAFRDKADFSDPKDYARVAGYAFEQAKAIRAHANELLAEATKKDIAEDAKKGGAA
jgi:hypothetical protein